jgi:hypothetical protein
MINKWESANDKFCPAGLGTSDYYNNGKSNLKCINLIWDTIGFDVVVLTQAPMWSIFWKLI